MMGAVAPQVRHISGFVFVYRYFIDAVDRFGQHLIRPRMQYGEKHDSIWLEYWTTLSNTGGENECKQIAV